MRQLRVQHDGPVQKPRNLVPDLHEVLSATSRHLRSETYTARTSATVVILIEPLALVM